jgi:flagellar motor switch protein FliM
MAVEEAVALDFSQPTKFTTELRRRMERAFLPFCEAVGAAFSSELKAEVAVRLSEDSQLTWAAAKAQLPADSIAVGVRAEGSERQMLLSVELPLMLQALECLLGGQAAQAPAERHLTEIDWVLIRGLLDRLIRELSTAWVELDGPPLSRGEVDLEGDAGVLVPVGEPTLLISLETTLDGLCSSIVLLIPWASAEPVAERGHGGGAHQPEADPRGAEALRRGLAGAQVMLRAEVGSIQMPLQRMLEFVPGSILRLEDRAAEGVRLFVEEVSLGRGQPGRSGARRAVKLRSTSEPATRADTYAKLGRAELERARAHAEGSSDKAEEREILRSLFVRVWAELGRTHLALGRALELSPGAVVELDQGAEAPVELFANGLCFAQGQLVVAADGEWGVQVDELV